MQKAGQGNHKKNTIFGAPGNDCLYSAERNIKLDFLKKQINQGINVNFQKPFSNVFFIHTSLRRIIILFPSHPLPPTLLLNRLTVSSIAKIYSTITQ